MMYVVFLVETHENVDVVPNHVMLKFNDLPFLLTRRLVAVNIVLECPHSPESGGMQLSTLPTKNVTFNSSFHTRHETNFT